MIWFLAILISLAPTYLIRFHIGPLPTTLLEVMIVGFLIATLFRLKIKDVRSKIIQLGKINFGIVLFVLAGIISTFISPEPIKALGLLRAFIIEPVLLFYAAVLIVNRQSLIVIFRFLFWSTLIISAFGIFQYFSFIHLPLAYWGYGDEPRRIVSVFGHPNALSLYLGPLFGLFVGLWINNYPLLKKQLVTLAGIMVIGFAILLTFSRGSWLGVTAGIIYILIQKFGFKKIAVPVLLVGAIVFFIPSVNQRILVGLSDPSSSAHFQLMRVGINKIITNPLFGNGLYGFRTTLTDANFAGEIHNYPHNILLSMWVELGLLGVVSFAWIINMALKKYRPKPEFFAASIFILIMLVHGLVDTPYFRNDLSVLFWFVISTFFI